MGPSAQHVDSSRGFSRKEGMSQSASAGLITSLDNVCLSQSPKFSLNFGICGSTFLPPVSLRDGRMPVETGKTGLQYEESIILDFEYVRPL